MTDFNVYLPGRHLGFVLLAYWYKSRILLCMPLTGFLTGLLAMMPLCAAAESPVLYQWTDQWGKRHISDRKPLQDEFKVLDPNTLPAIQRIPSVQSKPKSAVSQRKSRPSRKVKKKRRKKVDCSKYEKRLEGIQEKLRRGYREPQGNKLRLKRRTYRDLLYNCRKNS